ncbi:MAG: molybdopterin molybdotransferase MoeA [Nitrospiria bacterium]
MISVDEAQKIIQDHTRPIGIERVSLPECVGRILAEDVHARRDHPPWDNSAMDGYAVRWEDVKAASPKRPVFLRIVEEIPAGYLPRRAIRKGETARIMTGAPLPEGADSVIRKEDTSEDEKGVNIFTAGEKGEYVRARGMDVTTGSFLMGRGTHLLPPHVGMLAAVGKGLVTVHRRPRVAILATGNELADLDDPLSPEKIMDTNSYAVAAQAREAGAEPILIGIAKDTPEDVKEKLAEALSAGSGGLGASDVVVSSGGVSVGKYDFVKEVYEQLGIEIKFWRVAMKPGSPLAFGTYGEKLVFGLPGNPVSSMVTFELFVRPALRRMAGAAQIYRPRALATLTEGIKKSPEKSHFLRGWVQIEDQQYTVRTTGIQDSGVLSSMLAANALIILPEGRTEFHAGEKVEVHLLWQ